MKYELALIQMRYMRHHLIREGRYTVMHTMYHIFGVREFNSNELIELVKARIE